jgi:hypothetical protein
MKVIASARVRVTLDIQLTERWGTDCPLAQVHEQAKDTVLGMLRNNRISALQRADIVGTPYVEAILTEEDR